MNDTVTLEVKVTANKMSDGIRKLESFTELIEKLSKEAENKKITKLFVSADME